MCWIISPSFFLPHPSVFLLLQRYLVALGCTKPLCDLLTVMDSKIVQVALNGLENILRLGEQESKQNGMGVNPYCALIEEAYGKKLLLIIHVSELHYFRL